MSHQRFKSPREFVAYYHDGHQWRVGLIVERRRSTVVGNDGHQVRARLLTPEQVRHLRPIPAPPTIRQAKASLRRQGRRFGITKAARKLIRNPAPTPQRAFNFGPAK